MQWFDRNMGAGDTAMATADSLTPTVVLPLSLSCNMLGFQFWSVCFVILAFDTDCCTAVDPYKGSARNRAL